MFPGVNNGLFLRHGDLNRSCDKTQVMMMMIRLSDWMSIADRVTRLHQTDDSNVTLRDLIPPVNVKLLK